MAERRRFYRTLDLPVQTILTDNGREFCGIERQPYELYLALNDVAHRKTRVGSPRTNGFVERSTGTVLEEFFRPKLRSQFDDSVEALQADLDAWLHHYNHERPHLGYRNQGRRPWETVARVRQPIIRKTRRLRRQIRRSSSRACARRVATDRAHRGSCDYEPLPGWTDVATRSLV